MKLTLATALSVAALAGAAFADSHEGSGDVAAGEKGFGKCKSCHAVIDDEGMAILKGGKTGPNLYGIVGRQAGTVEGFKYGDDLVAAGEAGLVWDEESFTEYVKDPKKFLRAFLDDKKARSKMSFRLKKGGEDIYAFLVSVSPAMEDGEAEDDAKASEETDS